MTEIGMALSNPLTATGRRAGTVGQPLPGVECRIVDESGTEVPSGPGELRVRGPAIFSKYWGRPEATAESFDEQGYFRTGDTVEVSEDGYYSILGRMSVDIIKSGGYKLSALEIEGKLLENEAIHEVAVVGVEDEAYGEVVGAVVVGAPAEALTPDALFKWSKGKMAPYKVPRKVVVVETMPRNAMGKVNKKELVKVFESA